MKKTLIVVIVLAAIILVARPFFCNGKKDDKPANGTTETKQQPLSIGDNSDVFNQSFTQLLNAYNDLKNALVASDAAKATAAAQIVRTAADSLKVNEIKGDSTGLIKETALTYTSTITGSAQALAAEKDIEGKRKEFVNIADAIWTLTRTVRYNGKKLFWEYCPMAFDNRGAYWISYERDIKNPYFGSKMMTCGSVEDSIDYSK
jgi:Cu(I)/Ag(I) efflux system membrane fusion protein